MTATSTRSIDVQREADIEVLKLARQRVRALQDLLVRVDTGLSHELASPARKIDERLAWMLLARELEGGS